MIRKWSYITNYPLVNNKKHLKEDYTAGSNQSVITNSNNFSINNLPLVTRFRFKVFRKNTRFKTYNLGYTNFVRKTVSLYKRRTSWKNYVVLSSGWVKPNLKNRQLISFIQSKSLFQNVIPFPAVNTFTKNIVPIKNFGPGLHSINHSFLSKSLFNRFFSKTFKTRPSKSRSFIQSYDLKSLHKMHSLGLLIPSLSYENGYYPTDSLISKSLLTVGGSLINSTILHVTTKIVSLLRLLYIYMVLTGLTNKNKL